MDCGQIRLPIPPKPSLGHKRLGFQEKSFGWMSGPPTVGCKPGHDKRAIRL
jgi:hypothetical protein